MHVIYDTLIESVYFSAISISNKHNHRLWAHKISSTVPSDTWWESKCHRDDQDQSPLYPCIRDTFFKLQNHLKLISKLSWN